VKQQTGLDIPMTEPRWLSRFTDSSRQAAQYRKGRVLLAGDAAHIHMPAGGPGISTGLNDASNLAWRLAAVLRGHHDETWLEDYGTERHAAGEKVLQHTRAQTALMTPAPHTQPLRELLAELLSVPEARRFIARRVQGIDTRYGNSPNPLEGAWMPEPIDLSAGRFVLIAHAFDNRWGARLEVRPGDRPMLIRPDGFVAWAGEGDPTGAVAHWLGKP
jgi:hypothetical protein